MNASRTTGTLLSLATIALLGSSTLAKDLLFTPTDSRTLEKEIDLAKDGDTILIGPGSYELDLKICDKSIKIIGHSPKRTFITNSHDSHLITSKNEDDMMVTFENITFSGRSDLGAPGMAILTADTHFTNCTFTDFVNQQNESDMNYARGGAMMIDTSHSTFEDCRFMDNLTHVSGSDSVHASGAAFFASKSHLQIMNCDFSGNTSSTWILNRGQQQEISTHVTGGAIWAHGCRLTVTDSLFSSNAATVGADDDMQSHILFYGRGGAIYLSAHIHVGYQKSTFTNCTFSNNSVADERDDYQQQVQRHFMDGGALSIHLNQDKGGVLVTSCLFEDNFAPFWQGSAIFNTGDFLILKNNDFLCNANGEVIGHNISYQNNVFDRCDEIEPELQPEEEPCLYDLNGDGVVDQVDRRQVSSAIRSRNHDGPEDVNGDGRVDRDDLNLIRDNYGECP